LGAVKKVEGVPHNKKKRYGQRTTAAITQQKKVSVFPGKKKKLQDNTER